MRERCMAGQVDWDAHAFDYYKLIPFDFGIGEYSDRELKAIFERVDRWYDERGLRPPRRAAFHWGEVGVRVLPYLKARGRTFVYSTYHLGQVKWERLFPNWWPYGLNSLFYDYIPEDPEMYNIGAMLPRHLVEPDVLTGCTTWAGDNPTNDMDKAADRAAGSVRLALDSGFFSEITTHEQKFGVLSLEEIDRWLSLVSQRTDRFDIRGVSHDEAAEYTRARDESWISAASTPDGRAVSLNLDGKASVDLELAVFENDRDATSSSGGNRSLRSGGRSGSICDRRHVEAGSAGCGVNCLTGISVAGRSASTRSTPGLTRRNCPGLQYASAVDGLGMPVRMRI